MSAVQDLIDAITTYTTVYRKGDVVTEKTDGGLRVVEINDFPALPDRTMAADVHFFYVTMNEGTTQGHLRDLFDAAVGQPGEFTTLTLADVQRGPSYIEWGGWLGSQQLALQLLGMGEILGWWDLFTPEKFGLSGEQADAMAGAGYVMNAGLKEEIHDG